MKDSQAQVPKWYVIPSLLLVILLVLAYTVLSEFLLTLVWALVISYVTWPLYAILRRRLNNNAALSAGVMTISLTVVVTLVVLWLVGLLQDELKTAYTVLADGFAQHPYQLPDNIRRLPWLGDMAQIGLDHLDNDRAAVMSQVTGWLKQGMGKIAYFAGGIGHNIIKLGVIWVTVFFCFRDGEEAIRQINRGLVRFLGEHQHVYLQAAGDTTRAVVYGLTLAALGQGILAGLGYAVAGVKAPVLFAAITALLALVPMGATLVWMPLGLVLIASAYVWQGVGLLLWGFLVVSTVDNVIRPLVISGASRVPFLIVLLGVLGGLNAFGAVGLFLGPVILSVLLAVWQVWLTP